MRRYVAAIDQGTTSSRCIVFDHQGRIAGVAQREHEQIFPRPGWVEHDPESIWRNTESVIAEALRSCGIGAADVVAAGVTNQRETTVVWERATGKPIHNAIVWQD
ncbi:FGGY family carbohydrate kinase, partial [Nocardia sp. NPDC059154]